MVNCLVCKKKIKRKVYVYIPYLNKSICCKLCLKYFKAKQIKIDKYLDVYDFLLVFALDKTYISRRSFYTYFKHKYPFTILSKNQVNSVFTVLNQVYHLKPFNTQVYYCNYAIIHQFVMDSINIECYIKLKGVKND